jgi:LacI family transcriptional regulator
MEEVTLKQIAKTLGISIATVSKALKNYPDVSQKTKIAVMELANNLHYTPNSFAVNLRTKESKTIGLIIPDVENQFFSGIIKGVIDQAEKNDYLVIILQSNESLPLEIKQVELLINKRVDGILMSLSAESNDDDHLKSIIKRKIPLVQFDKISKLIPSSKVIINDQKAAMDAVQHLIDRGCRKIAHFRGPENPQNAIDRFLGYKKCLEKNDIIFDTKLVFTCEEVTYEEGYNYAKKIHNEEIDIDGIFAINDKVAIGALNYFRENKIKVPKKIAVIGFSNSFVSQVVTPRLSSVDQPSYEMGVSAFNLLLEEMISHHDSKTFTPRTIELKTSVIERQSTMKL